MGVSGGGEEDSCSREFGGTVVVKGRCRGGRVVL